MQTMFQGISGTYYSPRFYFLIDNMIVAKGLTSKKQSADSKRGYSFIEAATEKSIRDSIALNLNKGAYNDTLYTAK